MKVIVVLALLVATVFCQNLFVSQIIDDFTEGSVLVSVNGAQDAGGVYTSTVGASSTHIYGGERDLFVDGRSSSQFEQTSSYTDNTANPPQWAVNVGVNGGAIVSMTYDGIDGDFTNIGNLNANLIGTYGLRTTIAADLSAQYQFQILDNSGNQCSETLDLIGGGSRDYDVAFADFNGGCNNVNFGSIRAIIVTALADSNAVDSVVTLIALTTEQQPTPSGTPTPTRTRTPDVSAPATPSPSRSATPTNSPDCICHCPVFTCALIFDPDDDENDAYYFGSSDFGTNFTPFPNNNRNSNSNSNSNNNNSSDASALTMSVAVIFAVIALVF